MKPTNALGAISFIALWLAPAVAVAADACRVVGDTAEASGAGGFAAAVARGPLYAGVLAWLSGLGVSLTPCVYPMIAVTVSIFGAKQARSRGEGVLLSAVFVLGIVAMFVPLGVVMGLTGSMMGALLQSTWVVVGVSVLFLVMAASMFGAFDMDLPDALKNRLSGLGSVGYRGAFLLGLVSGVVAAPCTGPFLTGMLAWIAQTQSAVFGALAMGAFALGLGLPFFLVGAFAIQLPKSGKWMVHVKNGLGVVLVVAALYFLGTKLQWLPGLARPGVAYVFAMVVVATLGLALLVRATKHHGKLGMALKASGVILASAGFYLGLTGALQPSGSLEWVPLSLSEARSRAKAEERPLLVDFTASWCFACKELDKYTFSDPRVGAEASRFIAVKVDLSDDDDPGAERVKREHSIRGLPTVLAFDKEGREVLRCTDYVEPGPFARYLELVR